MSKSIFISCVYEDSHRIDKLEQWVSENKLGDIVLTYETLDKRQYGKRAIKQHILDKIRGASVVLVLIGNDTHNHQWITDEITFANSFHKKILCVRVPNTTGSVPDILRKYDIVNFDPHSILRYIKN